MDFTSKSKFLLFCLWRKRQICIILFGYLVKGVVMFKKSKKKKISLLFSIGLALVSSFAFVSASVKGSNEIVNVEASTSSFSWGEMDLNSYGVTFRDVLAGKINASGGKTIAYKTNNSVLAQSDKALDGDGVIPFYHSDSDSVSSFNKEHVWPDSRGAGKSGPGSDPQMLRPADPKENSSRSNYFYGPDRDRQWDPATFGYEAARGEAARIIFYTATRYGKSNGLSLSNNPHDATSEKTMGTLRYLVEWNKTYPVTAQEIRRNNYLHGQGFARNPFIDHPEWVNYIWSETGLRTSRYEDTGDYSLILDKSVLLLEKGETGSLKATITNSSSSTLVWTNSNNDVASIETSDDSTSVFVLTKQAGTSVVSVYSTDYPTVLSRCTIEIRENGILPDPDDSKPSFDVSSIYFGGNKYELDKVAIVGESLAIYPQGKISFSGDRPIDSIVMEGDEVGTLSYLAKDGETFKNVLYNDDGIELNKATAFEIHNLGVDEIYITGIMLNFVADGDDSSSSTSSSSSGCNGELVSSLTLSVGILTILIVVILFKFKRKTI